MIKIIKILFFLNIFNINSKYKKCCNKYYKKKNEYNNQNKDDEKDNKDKKDKNFNEKIKYSDFNKDFKFTFIKNSLFQHNNNCTLNAVFSSLFNFPQIQNLLIYNNFDNKLLDLSKNLLLKCISENDNNKPIDYKDINANILNFIKNNYPEYLGEIYEDSVKTDHFLCIFNNLGIICTKFISSFIDCKLKKTCLENKENIINLNKNKTNIVNFKESLKNINLVKYIFKELKYYDKLCKLIDNLNFNSENYHLFEPDNQAFIYNIDENISLDCKYFIIVPENENIKDYISKLPNEDIYFFYDKILEDNKIELELISINFIDPKYHIFTINKNVNDNKWYIFDDLYNENCVEANFEQLLKNGFFIEKSGHKYKPEFFYFNAKLKK